MPKYEVSHSVLSSPDRVFKQGEVVTPDDLTAAGFDVDFLVRNGAVEALKGTESDAPDNSRTITGTATPGEVLPPGETTGPVTLAGPTGAGTADVRPDDAKAARKANK